MAEKKKDLSWEEIGQAIGKKIEEGKGEWPHHRHWEFKYKHYGGGFGRLVFAVGVLFALSYAGLLVNIPSWVLVIIIIGFALMRL